MFSRTAKESVSSCALFLFWLVCSAHRLDEVNGYALSLGIVLNVEELGKAEASVVKNLYTGISHIILLWIMCRIDELRYNKPTR